MPNNISAVEDAAEALRRARRVAVFGCSGGGKSTFSQKLAPISRRQRRPRGLLVARLGSESAARTAGVDRRDRRRRQLDYRRQHSQVAQSTIAARGCRSLARMPRWLCLWSIVKRGVVYRGKIRSDMAPGCPERMPDLEFHHVCLEFRERRSPRIHGRYPAPRSLCSHLPAHEQD